MQYKQIIKTLNQGGRIVNNILVQPDNMPVQGKNSKVSDKQIERVIQNTDATRIVHYDRTRTVKVLTEDLT